jgi:hypothetical protein
MCVATRYWRTGFPGAYSRFCHPEEIDSVHFSSEMKIQSRIALTVLASTAASANRNKVTIERDLSLKTRDGVILVNSVWGRVCPPSRRVVDDRSGVKHRKPPRKLSQRQG